MRGLALFVAGALAGIAVTAGALAQSSLSPNRGVVGLNHVGIIVPDLDKAVEFYTKTMGFPEAFRFINPQTKQVQLVYVQISQNTFVELQPANGRPLGVSHFGLHVESTKDAVAMFKARGAKTEDVNVSGTKAILSNITDPYGNRMELSELPPESLHRQAMNRWK
jgi:catechol 2,3-dioxygenase-like lactoylglutathione lyase family enzyme